MIASWAAKGWFELRDYLNEGGKAVLDGRNVHQRSRRRARASPPTRPVQLTPTRSTASTTRPTTAATTTARAPRSCARTTSTTTSCSTSSVSPSRAGGYGTTTYNAAPVAPVGRRHLRRLAPFTRRHRGGQRPEPERRRHDPCAARQVRHAPAHALERDLATAAAPGARRARRPDHAGPDRQRRRGHLDARHGHVRLRPRAGRRGDARRAASRARSTTCCRRRPTPRRRRSSASSTRPTAPTATPADPVEPEVHRLRRARRHEGGPPLRQRRRSSAREVFPFQFRYSADRGAVGHDGHAAGRGERQGGQRRSIDRRSASSPRRGSCRRRCRSQPPTLTGTPTVGSTLTCVNGGFLNSPTRPSRVAA